MESAEIAAVICLGLLSGYLGYIGRQLLRRWPGRES